MKVNLKHSALMLVLLTSVGVTQATTLGTNAPVNTVAQTGGSFGGMLLDSVITPISNTSYNGTARAAVYDTGTGLDFYYQFTNNANSQNGLERFSMYDFSSLGASTVDVFQTGAAFGIFTAGTETSDGADRTNFGVIGFSFIPNTNSKINPGTTSFTQIIRTNARQYTPGNFGLLDGIADNAAGFAPSTVSAVPEPETYAMLLAGLGLVGSIIRRRAANQA